MTASKPPSTLSFELSSANSPQFGPRLGRATLRRHGEQAEISIDTPALISSTSRGVVPHLTRDHYTAAGDALSWVHVPFESL